VSYADDISIFVTAPEDITGISDDISCYERLTGAILNVYKSKAFAVGKWNAALWVLDTTYSAKIKILGFRMTNTIAQSRIFSWTGIKTMVRTQAREANSRDLGLSQRIQYVHAYLLAKLLNSAQIFPAPRECISQILSAGAWYIWRGTMFRVPTSTLQRKKEERGWGLIYVEEKCRALLLTWMWTQSKREASTSAEWLRAGS
jgi:hypothetical protein